MFLYLLFVQVIVMYAVFIVLLIDLDLDFLMPPHIVEGISPHWANLAMSGLPCHIILKWAIPVLPLSLVVECFTEKQGDWQINGLC